MMWPSVVRARAPATSPRSSQAEPDVNQAGVQVLPLVPGRRRDLGEHVEGVLQQRLRCRSVTSSDSSCRTTQQLVCAEKATASSSRTPVPATNSSNCVVASTNT